MKYTAQELAIMLEETEKALYVERKFSETYQKFLYDTDPEITAKWKAFFLKELGVTE